MTTLRACILGEPRIEVDDAVVDIASRKQRALLAMLAIASPAPIDLSRIADDLWEDRPPATARKNLQVLVHGLRGAWGRVDAIERTDRGYALAADVLVDAAEAATDVEVAGTAAAAGRHDEVVRAAGAALARWYGDALGEHRDQLWAIPAGRRIDELRLEARELELAARLARGEHGACVALLDELVLLAPDRPRLHELRIEALAAAGLEARALEACGDAVASLRPGEVDGIRRLWHRLTARD